MRTYSLAKAPVFLFVLVFAFDSCSHPPVLNEFDAAAWQQDQHGCGGKRTEMISKLLDQKGKLLALNELEMIELIGKPDAHEIYKRSEKFFYYSIEGDSSCATPSLHARKLVIRFNAMGLAKEVSLE